ncbi:hypothetical protein [Ligilactobacillus ruminis]|uniref:hypothetical protein n=1 Tax=Ligilactobacillus ruminis TaxID=1623 RepID=UPI00325B868D
MSKKGTLPVNESWHLRQISKISILPVSQSCALIEQEMLSTAFGKICIKIEKCRTKAADLRRLCSTFNAIQEENIFSHLLLYCNSVVAIASSTVVSALPSLFGSMLQATDAITK